MTNRVFLRRCAHISPEGMGLVKEGFRSWQDSGYVTPLAGEDGTKSAHPKGELPKLKAQWFFKEAFMKFGRMDRYTQLVLAVAQCCMDDTSIDGLVLGSAWGSIHQDQLHSADVLGEGQSSPATFTYTLPSVALGEVSILRQHHGENLMVEAAETSGLQALLEGFWWVRSGRVKECLVIVADYLDPQRATAWACLLNAQGGDLELLHLQAQFKSAPSRASVGCGDAGFKTLAEALTQRDSKPHSLREVSSLGHILDISWTFSGDKS